MDTIIRCGVSTSLMLGIGSWTSVNAGWVIITGVVARQLNYRLYNMSGSDSLSSVTIG